MIPFRLVMDALKVPLRFETATDSLVVGPDAEQVLRVFPLLTRRTGLVIHTPSSGTECIQQVRIQGQANIPDGEAIVQLRAGDGSVLLESKLPKGVGYFREFLVLFQRATGEGGTENVQLVAFAPDPEDGSPRHQVIIPLKWRLSDRN